MFRRLPEKLSRPATPEIRNLGWQQYAWGNAPNDVQDRVARGIDYALPFGNSMHGIMATVVSRWSTNLSGSWQTDLPLTATGSLNNSVISNGYLDQTCSGKAANPSLLDWFNIELLH